MSNELEYVTCLCGEDNSKLVWRKRGFNVVQCVNCGLVYTNPRLSSEHLLNSTDHYNVDQENIQLYIQYYLAHREITFDRILRHLEHMCSKDRNMLEVGSNAGFFLEKAIDIGWNAQGIEPSPVHATYAQTQLNVPVINALLEEVEFDEQTFNVIVLLDVLEHISNPMITLKQLHKWLKPGGKIVIRVPNGDALTTIASSPLLMRWYRRLYTHYFYPINPEQHYYHFSPMRLNTLLRDTGYNPIHLMNEKFDEMPSPGSLLKRIVKYSNKRIGTWLGFPSEFVVFAEKEV